MKQGKTELFFIFLILIAVAGVFLFFKSGTIQYPGHGVWAENWLETETTTKSTIHIVGTTSSTKESACFENLDGNLYDNAYLSGERFDNSDCPVYEPIVSKFYIENNQPCVSIEDKTIYNLGCYSKTTDREIELCLQSSGYGHYRCKISDVQNTLVLKKKSVITIPPISIPPNDFINLPTKNINTDMILWIIAGVLGFVALFMISKRR